MRKKQVPTGAIQPFAGEVAPDGWLICDGSPISRTLYPKLFETIGTAHGVGDGTTTFNLPDYRYQVPRGKGGVASQNFLPAAVNLTSEEITITGHQYKRTGFRVRVSTTGALPGGLAANTDYYVIIVNANTIKLATTRANALAGTAINLNTSQGTGVHTISQAEGPDYSLRTAVNGGNAGDNVGSLEEDAVRSHNHPQRKNNYAGGASWGGPHMIGAYEGGANPAASTPQSTDFTGSSETRTNNILCNYIIKAE